MNATKHLIILFIIALLSGCRQEEESKVTDFVDFFPTKQRDTTGFPGAIVPSGNIRLGPNKPLLPYRQAQAITAFSPSYRKTDTAHTGIYLLPTTSPLQPGASLPSLWASATAAFSPEEETAEPGSYRVRFHNGITTELAVSKNCGMFYFEFPPESTHGMVLFLADQVGAVNETHLEKVNNRTLRGYRKYTLHGKTHVTYFQLECSQDMQAWSGTDTARPLLNGRQINTTPNYTWINFGTTTNKILVKLSTSSSGTNKAADYLVKEMPHWSFDKVKRDAKQQWRRVLNRIKIHSTDRVALHRFYTALYHHHATPHSPASKHVFQALGFHPMYPDSNRYQLGLPAFAKIVIRLDQDRRFVIKTILSKTPAPHTQQILLNNKPLSRPWITRQDIIRGGKLQFILPE